MTPPTPFFTLKKSLYPVLWLCAQQILVCTGLNIFDGGVQVKAQKERSLVAMPNNVAKVRESLLMSRAELAKAAGLSVLTIERVEKGHLCRLSTKRKILKALGLKLSDKEKVFSS